MSIFVSNDKQKIAYIDDDMNNHLVIMAGGIGSRFWPMSTPECPKQFIDVLGCGRTLLQLTADRFRGICDPEHIWVVTSARYADIVHNQLPEVPEENILKEPCMRNTAPCVAYVSWKILQRDATANIVVAASDHVVMDVPEFQRVIKGALAFTADKDCILTLGMKPTRPETGYGYIEAGEETAAGEEIRSVRAFREKPDLATAQSYVKQSRFFWNSGIFIWRADTIVAAMRRYQPEIAAVMDRMAPSFYTSGEQAAVDSLYAECPSISVDYAILEKSDKIYVFPASFGWSDLGTWGSLHEKLGGDEQNNVVVGQEVKLFETKNCIVHVSEERRVVIQGLDGYIVAEKNDTLLICKLSEEQRIKEFSK